MNSLTGFSKFLLVALVVGVLGGGYWYAKKNGALEKLIPNGITEISASWDSRILDVRKAIDAVKLNMGTFLSMSRSVVFPISKLELGKYDVRSHSYPSVIAGLSLADPGNQGLEFSMRGVLSMPTQDAKNLKEQPGGQVEFRFRNTGWDVASPDGSSRRVYGLVYDIVVRLGKNEYPVTDFDFNYNEDVKQSAGFKESMLEKEKERVDWEAVSYRVNNSSSLSGNLTELNDFVTRWPTGFFISTAKGRIFELERRQEQDYWTTLDTLKGSSAKQGMEQYLTRYSSRGGSFVPQAQERLAKLSVDDDTDWEKAQKDGSRYAIREYYKLWYNGKHAQVAWERLKNEMGDERAEELRSESRNDRSEAAEERWYRTIWFLNPTVSYENFADGLQGVRVGSLLAGFGTPGHDNVAGFWGGMWMLDFTFSDEFLVMDVFGLNAGYRIGMFDDVFRIYAAGAGYTRYWGFVNMGPYKKVDSPPNTWDWEWKLSGRVEYTPFKWATLYAEYGRVFIAKKGWDLPVALDTQLPDEDSWNELSLGIRFHVL